MPNVHPDFICQLVDAFVACRSGDDYPLPLGTAVSMLAELVEPYMYQRYCKVMQHEMGREDAVAAWRRFQEFDKMYGTAVTDLSNKQSKDGAIAPKEAAKRVYTQHQRELI